MRVLYAGTDHGLLTLIRYVLEFTSGAVLSHANTVDEAIALCQECDLLIMRCCDLPTAEILAAVPTSVLVIGLVNDDPCRGQFPQPCRTILQPFDWWRLESIIREVRGRVAA